MKHTTTTTGTIKALLTVLVFMALLMPSAYASIKLDGVSTDPAIIAAGDEVDVVVTFRNMDYESIDDDDDVPKLNVTLMGAESVTNEYVTILDNKGEGSVGHLFMGESWRSVFSIKVHQDAPVGMYEFVLVFERYNNQGEQIDGVERKYFTLDVKKEGVNILTSNINTNPSIVRSGDDYVDVDVFVENVGEKAAKTVDLSLTLPEYIEHSYSNANDVRIGRLEPGAQKKVTFTVNVDKGAPAKEYVLGLEMDYLDMDDNDYSKNDTFSLLIKEKPVLEVVNYTGSGLAGSTGTLEVVLKNVGSETAEAVDARIVKQNSQPFSFDVRSNYVGSIEPGETATAVFDIAVNSDASFKEHDFSMFIRAKGDSDNNNDNIYTFSDNARFNVTGQQPNYLLYVGLAFVGIVVLIIIVRSFNKR